MATHAERLRSLADKIEGHFRRDVIEVWFPRCVDTAGGFHENYLNDWTPAPDETRSLIFQSRMVWFTSQLVPHDRAFRDYCTHGLDYLLSTALAGEQPIKMEFTPDGADKTRLRSSYSIAFAIFALANAGRALNRRDAIEKAVAIFRYLEDVHKDRSGRGYFEFSTLEATLVPLPGRGESLGQLFKHQNSHLHLLEAFSDLYRAWPDPLLRERLREVMDFMALDLGGEHGTLADHVKSDGTVAAGHPNFGHDVEVAHLLLSASNCLASKEIFYFQTAQRLLDHSLENGWDGRGGFWSETGHPPSGQTKVWWVQMEGLLGLAEFYRLTLEPRYLSALESQWNWISEFQIDREHRGVFSIVLEDGTSLSDQTKGNTWKAAYHDGRALLFVPTILRETAAQV